MIVLIHHTSVTCSFRLVIRRMGRHMTNLLVTLDYYLITAQSVILDMSLLHHFHPSNLQPIEDLKNSTKSLAIMLPFLLPQLHSSSLPTIPRGTHTPNTNMKSDTVQGTGPGRPRQNKIAKGLTNTIMPTWVVDWVS